MRIQDTRSIHCIEYLERIGLKPVRQQRGTNGLEYVYKCPLREDKDPSLCVNVQKNIWSDRPTAQGGRLIELVFYINDFKDDVSRALSILDSTFTDLKEKKDYTPPKIQQQIFKNTKPIEIIEVKKIWSYPLKNYLEKERKINLTLALPYIQEVRYKPENGKIFYAIGFKSGEAYSLRSKFFKGFAGTNADISILDKKTSVVNLFEGFIDFLSLLTLENTESPQFTTVVLNTSSLLKRFIDFVKKHQNMNEIHYYRDKDELDPNNKKPAGLITLQTLKEELPNIKIIDKSEFYPFHKDLNDFLVSQ